MMTVVASPNAFTVVACELKIETVVAESVKMTPPLTSNVLFKIKSLRTLVLPVVAPIVIEVAVFTISKDEESVLMLFPLTAKSLLIVVLPSLEPILIAIASPKALTSVALLLNRETSVNDVLMTPPLTSNSLLTVTILDAEPMLIVPASPNILALITLLSKIVAVVEVVFISPPFT